MKKFLLPAVTLCFSAALFAAQPQAEVREAEPPAECSLPKEAAAVPAAKLTPAKKLTPAEEKKAFEARRKLINKLVKQYRKAPEAKKPAIKARLAEAVSESVDAGMAYLEGRIAAERANLDNWEAKLKEDQKNLPEIKARRVEDLISGEAKRKHKAAKKAWKKQMKAAKSRLK